MAKGNKSTAKYAAGLDLKRDGLRPVVFGLNQKKKGSKAYSRYQSYHAASSLREAMRMGASKADLNYDFNHGTVSFADKFAKGRDA